MKIALTVNGTVVNADVAPRTSLADLVRETLLLTGTHVGCEHGICGACTVEIDGQIARSCITYAVACDGANVRTIEAFDDDADDVMARLRRAFTQEHALQCGYCTPGMLIAARDLVRRKQGLSREDIRAEMSGNLCRCTGYLGVVNAIARVMAEAPAPEPPPARAAQAWLGPAPGPVGVAAAAREMPPAAAAREPVPPRPLRPLPAAPHRRAPIEVTVGGIEDAGGGVRLSQSFALQHPREAVWRLMSDPEAVARCMPGATLDGPPQDGRVTGGIAVKLGPVTAAFAGEGTVRQIPAEYRQIIEGRGGDKRSGSRVSGSVDYRLSAIDGPGGSEATRVDIVLSYALSGLLAQLGRSNLARDLAQRMGETFAQNVDAELHGGPATRAEQAPIGAFSLAWQVIAQRVRALLARIFGA